MSYDFKKEYKDLYLPKTSPMLIEVPEMSFIMVKGKGDPNHAEGEYPIAMEILYGLSWTIKMSYKTGDAPQGFYEFIVPPLEGLWWLPNYRFDGKAIEHKEDFLWIAMIRQPDFVTPEVFAWAQKALREKRPHMDCSPAKLKTFKEGLCAQVLHLGPYDDEPATIERLNEFIEDEGMVNDISGAERAFPLKRRHHEIYLGDPRKAKPENLKTVIRHPVKKAKR